MNFFSAFLGFLSLKELLKSNNNKKIVFFSESKNYRNYLINLMKSFEDKEDISVIYLTSDIKDNVKISDKINPVFIGSGFFRILIFMFIKCEMIIMTLTDLDIHEIKKSKKCKNYVYIFHALVSTHKCYTHTAFKNFDVILSNGEYQKKELRYCEKLFNFKEKKIFNTGYLYLEKLLDDLKNNFDSQDNNKILFALSWNKSANNLFDNYAESFLKKLVELEYKVTLRTHPEATKRSKKTISRVKKNLQSYKNFEINTDILNLKPLNDSSLLITDDGGIALEYYIIYKKPVLYINYLEKIHNLYFDKIKINTIEKEFKNEIGTSMELDQLENLDYFIKKTKYDFKNKREKISELVDKNELILKDQTLNAKKAILKLIYNDN
jgi:hypothetical protein